MWAVTPPDAATRMSSTLTNTPLIPDKIESMTLWNNTGYLHVIFCNIHSYNANDIDRYLYLLFLLYPILFAKISTRTSFTIIVPSTFLWPSHSHLRNYKSKHFQIKKDNNNCYKMFVVTSDWMRCATHQLRLKKKKVRPPSMLHQIVWGVPPATSDEK